MSTDRPGLAESTDTVRPGAIQLEGGFAVSQHALAAGSSHEIGAPFSLIRIGLARFAELRLGSDGFAIESRLVNGQWDRHSGGSDFEAGIKARVWNERKYIPSFAVIGALSVPTGSAYSTSGSRDPLLELCWSKSLPRDFDVGGNVNFRWDSAETEHSVSVSIGKKLSHGFGTYGEVYRISPIDGDEPAHWIANTGITKQLGVRTQIDAEIGRTLYARTPYWFVGAGFAIRFSKPTFFEARSRRTHDSSHSGS
jgi:hypothetical protein